MKENHCSVVREMSQNEIGVHLPIFVDNTGFPPFFRQQNLPSMSRVSQGTESGLFGVLGHLLYETQIELLEPHEPFLDIMGFRQVNLMLQEERCDETKTLSSLNAKCKAAQRCLCFSEIRIHGGKIISAVLRLIHDAKIWCW